jgi:hypothetical protein
VRWAAIAAVLLLALAILWTASEQHYRNCLHAAPDRAGTYRDTDTWDTYTARVDRARAGCSRLPL